MLFSKVLRPSSSISSASNYVRFLSTTPIIIESGVYDKSASAAVNNHIDINEPKIQKKTQKHKVPQRRFVLYT